MRGIKTTEWHQFIICRQQVLKLLEEDSIYSIGQNQQQIQLFMSYLQTPTNYNSNSIKKLLTPTTANSKNMYSSSRRNANNLFSSVKEQINSMITQAETKRNQSNYGISTVYRANQQLLQQLNPQRDLRLENEQLRRQLDQALRQIARLNRIIRELSAQNQMLRRSAAGRGYEQYGNDILRELDQLKSEGDNLRMKTINLLRYR